MIISALTSKAACFCHGFSLLQKRILLSYCIYIFTLSTNGSSLSISPLQSVFTTSRTSSFCAYCSKSSLTYSGSHDIDVSSNSISAATPNKITSIEPNQDVLGVPTAPYGGSSNLPKGYHSARVLLVGDGDLSFAAALSTLKVCKSLTASSWDTKERLIKSFPRAEENIRIIEENGDTVQYEVDATQLTECMDKEHSFDLIAWNFPHIAGKQNIKRNRELVQNFLMSAFSLLNSEATGRGMVKIALCVGQSGTKAADMDDWNFSWKLIHQAAEAGCLLTDIEEFPLNAFPGYKVTGHRGHGGDFPTGTEPEIFTFKRSALGTEHSVTMAPILSIDVKDQCVDQSSTADGITSNSAKSSDMTEVAPVVEQQAPEGSGDIKEEGQEANYVALQAPSYIHEVHLLAVSMVSDLIDLERRAREGVKLIVAQFEEEEEMERLAGGLDRAKALDLIRLEKQLLPVRRRYRTQEDRDEMTAAKLALGGIEGPAPGSDTILESDSDSSTDIDIDIDSGYDIGSSSGSNRNIACISRFSSNTSTGRHASSVWAVNLVDVYTCPRTQQISHAFQVTYCSLTRPIGRTVADTYRKRVERDLPIYLGMVPRVVKHGGLVSLSYPWYVTAAVKTHLAAAALSSACVLSGTEGGSGAAGGEDQGSLVVGGERVDVSDLAAILRELEHEEREKNAIAKASTILGPEAEGSTDSDDASSRSSSSESNIDADDSSSADTSGVGEGSNRENIRTIARTLWKKRVGVLMQSTSVPKNIPKQPSSP